MGAVVRVSVPAPLYVECRAQPPAWNLSLARVWFAPSLQLAASAALVPAVSKPGLSTTLPLGTGVLVMVGVGVREGVGVRVGVFVTGVLVGGVTVTPEGASEISSNQMSPVGEPSVMRRSVTLVVEPLLHAPLRYCQLPLVLPHNWRSPTRSFISMQAAPVVFVRQM